MPSTFTALQIGLTGLRAYRRNMEVTGHNVANAATEGYSRQEVLLEPFVQRNMSLNAGTSGLGVRIQDTRRVRDRFIDAILRGERSRKVSFEAEKLILDHLQVVLGEPSDSSIEAALNEFWSSWHDLSSDPHLISARATVMEKGRTLASLFRNLGVQLDAVSHDIEVDIRTGVNRVNYLASEIARITLEIQRALARHEPLGDLLDKRDLMLDEITELTGATVTLKDAESVRVSVGGLPLVDGQVIYKLDVAFTASGTEFRWQPATSPSGQYEVVTAMGGRLGGLRSARDESVLGFKSQLEGFFRDFVDRVNQQHAKGYHVYSTAGDPVPDPADPQNWFFAVGNPTDYLNSVDVNPIIIADPGFIRASSEAGDPLNGRNAMALADLIEGADNPSDVPTFNETWQSIVGALGVRAQKIQSGITTQELLVKELANRKDSISGVSTDEEMANLIRFQHAYDACARVITVADEMLDTLINRMGISGR